MKNQQKQLSKALLFTDIHFGRKQNSDTHNQHCSNFIDFLIAGVDKFKADHIIFLGDWYENRNAISVSTINYAYNCASKLNSLGIPIYFIVGNHDMNTRHTRETYSTIDYNQFSNFKMIDTIVEDHNIYGGALFCPFLFHAEYENLSKYSAKNVYGHFEFDGFIITGSGTRYSGGNDGMRYGMYNRIFSGHFHARQHNKNIQYIGNTFPMDFSDANDFDRGYAFFDSVADHLEFVNWIECPKYINVNLSDIVADKVTIPEGATVKCIQDIDLDHSKLMEIKTAITDIYKLESLSIFEPAASIESDEEFDDLINNDLLGIDDMIVEMLHTIDTPTINNAELIKIYRGLKTD
jgi:DNA repair exonuclease SbcCD nuclease subunit